MTELKTLKPIETRYGGCRFRSRLEARWAVFFDDLGWRWDYEPEGYELPFCGNYLPDFLVTPPESAQWSTGPFWAEVKGQRASKSEKDKIRELACLSGKYGTFLHSPYKTFEQSEWIFGMGTRMSPGDCFTDWQVPHSEFHELGKERTEFICIYTSPFYRELDSLLERMGMASALTVRKLKKAAKAAQSARFEHGEKG